jgi:SAM-dependent methyltransferase
MKLLDLNIDSYDTDKNTVHCYIEQVYNELFANNDQITNVLEIGAFNGGNALLWRDYFTNATVDIIDINKCEAILQQWRINFIQGNAYSIPMVQSLNKYDIMIDDGPHTLDSMTFFVQNYIKLLKSNGVAIIEDVQDYSWFEILLNLVPSGFVCESLDLRRIKGRYDDMMLIIKNKHL